MTINKPVLDADGTEVPLADDFEITDLFRAFMAGRVPAPGCPHYITAEERAAGFERCERCSPQAPVQHIIEAPFPRDLSTKISWLHSLSAETEVRVITTLTDGRVVADKRPLDAEERAAFEDFLKRVPGMAGEEDVQLARADEDPGEDLRYVQLNEIASLTIEVRG